MNLTYFKVGNTDLIRSRGIFLYTLENLLNGQWYQAGVFVATAHGVGFTWRCLTIGEDCDIDTTHGSLDELLHLRIENFLGWHSISKHRIKSKEFFCSHV